MKHGFLKVCAATPAITAADCPKNGSAILAQILEAADKGAKVIVFPELCVTGSTCGDLFRSRTLLDSARETLLTLIDATADRDILCAVGLPVYQNGVMNCCALFHQGELLCLFAKTALTPEEQRYFRPGEEGIYELDEDEDIDIVTSDLIALRPLKNAFCTVQIGEKPSGSEFPDPADALLVLHPSAERETVRSEEHRLESHRTLSRLNCCAYVTACAGEGESTTDCVFGGQRILAENGEILKKSEVFTTGLTVSEVDLDLLQNKRLQRHIVPERGDCYRRVVFEDELTPLTRTVSPAPFLPAKESDRTARVHRLLDLQCAGLSQRLRHTNCKAAVLGLSGGLDSTLALLVTARAYDRLGWDRSGISAVTMPCFGTTGRTCSNAEKLAEALSVSFQTVDITAAVQQHFEDIGQSPDSHDVTYENAQARERTQVLMDLANQKGGMVIGTGDLSELALGWATYNGDHMSMYGVNSSIPKTLMRHMVATIAEESDSALQSVLRDILDTPVSPELLPAKDGEVTEELVGPYELHDFFLYHILGNGFSPEKVQRLADLAFSGRYAPEVILRWLQNFYRRFFSQQFKRSCLPDGPAVGNISLSPRGGFSMPSDAVGRVWLEELSEN